MQAIHELVLYCGVAKSMSGNIHGSISRVDAKTLDELVLLCWIAKSMMASFTESILPNVNNNSATEANMKCQITVYVKLFSGI